MCKLKNNPFTLKRICGLVSTRPADRERQKGGGKTAQWGDCESNDLDPMLESLLTYRRRVQEDQEDRDKEKGKRQEARAGKNAREEDERAAAIAKFKLCRWDAGCTCGEQPCTQLLLHLFKARNTVKKCKCSARACAEALEGAGGQCGSSQAAGAGGAAGPSAEGGGAES